MDLASKITEANSKALGIIHRSDPHWVDVKPAGEVIPGMTPQMILHAGPPVSWDRMCSAQRNAVVGAILFEGLANGIAEAQELVQEGAVEISPCHEHSSVGSMTGVVSASMPVHVIEDSNLGNRSFVTIHEGPSRQRLTYGTYNEDVHRNLVWIREVLAPALRCTVEKIGSMPIAPLIAKALVMGDECHNRALAGSHLFAVEVIPYIIRSKLDRESVARIAEFIGKTEHFFFHLVMGACKAQADAIRAIPNCSLVTAMARNGVEVGIQVSATDDRWFTGRASEIEGSFFPGYGRDDAEADMGDSAITETMGLGAFAMAASFGMAHALGGTSDDAIRYQLSMERITAGLHPHYRVPAMDFKGTPLGIDIRKVVDTGVVPIIDTGIASKEGGEIGVGLARAPIEAFVDALKFLGETVKTKVK
jgi:hypothetical protein